MIRCVTLSDSAKRDLRRVPQHIARKLLAWMDSVEEEGLEVVRRRPGYHDEPLKGQRQGQRSIRLSKGYRAIYIVLKDGTVECARVEEVHHHEY